MFFARHDTFYEDKLTAPDFEKISPWLVFPMGIRAFQSNIRY